MIRCFKLYPSAVPAIVLLYPTHDTVLYTLSKATQIATFEAVPLSGINCPPPTNGIGNHFRETQIPFTLGTGLHKLWYPVVRDMSTWSKFGAHGEHGDVFLFSNLGAL